jgi:hypothetical protein
MSCSRRLSLAASCALTVHLPGLPGVVSVTAPQDLYAQNSVACIWLLQTLMADQATLRRLLFETDDEATRTALSRLLSLVVESVVKNELPLPNPKEVAPALPAGPPPLVSTGSGRWVEATPTKEELEAASHAPFLASHGQVAVTFIEVRFGVD